MNNLHGSLIFLNSIQICNKLITKLRNEIIIKGDGYWSGHYNFNKETKTKLNYFIGLGRADEIIINIILPIYSVYFEINGNKEQSQKVLDLYLNYYQKEGNHLVDQINNTLGLKNEKYQKCILSRNDRSF